MTTEQLRKHKQHCDMHNCETCKLLSDHDQLIEQFTKLTQGSLDLYAVLAVHYAETTHGHIALQQLVDLVTATKRQLLEELEAKAPIDHQCIDHPEYYAEDCLTCQVVRGRNQANVEHRILIQQKKNEL